MVRGLGWDGCAVGGLIPQEHRGGVGAAGHARTQNARQQKKPKKTSSVCMSAYPNSLFAAADFSPGRAAKTQPATPAGGEFKESDEPWQEREKVALAFRLGS